MADYNITLSDGVTIVSIADGSVDLTSADIPLVGQNSQLYGDDIAKAQLFMLENFANSIPPSINPLVGQIWYDNVNNNLNVYNGVDFDPIASVAQGTVQNSTLRFDGTDTWLEETRVQISSSGVLSIFDPALTNSITMVHDGIDVNVVTTGNAGSAIKFTGSHLNMLDGKRIAFFEVGNVAALEINQVGNNSILQTVFGGGDKEIQMKFLTNLRVNAVLALEEKSSSPANVPGYGQLWVRDDPAQKLIFTDEGGTDFELNATVGAADHGVLTGLGDDDHPQYAEIGSAEPNITGVWTFASQPNFNNAGAPFTVVNTGVVTNLNADLLDGSNASAFAAVGDTVNLTGAQSPAGVKTFTDILKVNTGVGGAGQGVRVLGLTSSDSTNSGFFSIFHQDEGQEQGRFGTVAGTAAIEVRAITANLDLYASNALKLRLNSTESFMQFSPGIDMMRWHQAGSSGTDTTSATIFDTFGDEFNVGYNETAERILSSSRNIEVRDIGKFLRRSLSTSRTLTLNTASGVPVGGSCMVHNDNASGSLTVAQSGITLEFVDGSGVAPLTGNRTIAFNGVATLRKKSSSVWQIWGNGIS